MKKKLIMLVADKNMKFTLEGLLSRSQAFNIQNFTDTEYDIYIHPLRDPGVYKESAGFLRPFSHQYHYAIVFFDREGSGQEAKSAEQISAEVKSEIEKNGWPERVEVIVFDPELEIWAWGNSPHLARFTGWENLTTLCSFVQERGYWDTTAPKPHRPKEAFDALLQEKQIQRSSAIYRKIAAHASFLNCIDPAFLKFKKILYAWFRPEDKNLN